MRGATWGGGHGSCTVKFQSTPLMRGATPGAMGVRHRRPVSIHAPHARGDSARRCAAIPAPGFNPRPSCEGRPGRRRTRTPSTRFNPRPSCEGRRTKAKRMLETGRFQSTPLMRGATEAVLAVAAPDEHVSIHAPHARGDNLLGCASAIAYMFQSTPLMRGATRCRVALRRLRRSFNPRPSCEGRPSGAPSRIRSTRFNPRPSCEGRPATRIYRPPSGSFNPRPSCEGRQSGEPNPQE